MGRKTLRTCDERESESCSSCPIKRVDRVGISVSGVQSIVQTSAHGRRHSVRRDPLIAKKILTQHRTLIEANTDVDAIAPTPEQDSVSYTVPLTIICGFLGAGKSTLVRYVLRLRITYGIPDSSYW